MSLSDVHDTSSVLLIDAAPFSDKCQGHWLHAEVGIIIIDTSSVAALSVNDELSKEDH